MQSAKKWLMVAVVSLLILVIAGPEFGAGLEQSGRDVGPDRVRAVDDDLDRHNVSRGQSHAFLFGHARNGLDAETVIVESESAVLFP